MTSESGLSWNYPACVGGLQDPSTKHHQNRRAVFKLVNELRSNGLQGEVDIPQIAVVGSQSVGKSSLIESIAGITLPRAQGTCTRCPIECRLSRSTSPWSCEVYLRLSGQRREIPFGLPFSDRSEVEERIRRAQLAILNPSKRATDFLGTQGSTNTGIQNERSFSSDLISVRISGKDEDDLSFVDLPGVISSVRDGGNDTDIEEVKDLVLQVIEKPSCLILLVVSAETDLENQGARRLVSGVDPGRLRTIPVLTKPDRIANGEHSSWFRTLSNGQDHYPHGWFCVKQSDQVQLEQKISYADARENERRFFALKHPWSSQDKDFRSRLGTPCLTRALGSKLFDLISESLPRLRREVEEKVLNVESELEELPTKPVGDPVAMIWNLIDAFKRDIDQLVKGRPEAGEAGLVQTFRKEKEQFRQSIHNQAPEFKLFDRPAQNDRLHRRRPLSEYLASPARPEVGLRGAVSFGFDEPSGMSDTNTVVYLNEVLAFAKHSRTRELPDNHPYAVTEHYVRLFTRRWPLPAKKLFENMERTFLKELKIIVDHHFSKFAPGELDSAILRTVLELLKRCGASAQDKMEQVIALEQEEPTTLNEDILKGKKREFHAKFKEDRKAHALPPPNPVSEDWMRDVLYYVSQRGFEGVTREDMMRALPLDESESAIEIMSEVCAYYEVAFRRFIDNIPMIIDLELLKGFNRTLCGALFEGLGLGEDIHSRCAAFLKEDPEVVRRRKMLQEHLERLMTALIDLQKIPRVTSDPGDENQGSIPEVVIDHRESPLVEDFQHLSTSPYRLGTPLELHGHAQPSLYPSFSSGSMVTPPNLLGLEPVEDAVPSTPAGAISKKKKGKGKKVGGPTV